MKLLWVLGRSLITIGCLLMALLAVYFGWTLGAFDATGFFGVPYTAAERASAWVFIAAALALTVLGGCMFVKHIGRLVWAALGISAAVIGLFLIIAGPGDDLWVTIPMFAGMVGGYYLARWADGKRAVSEEAVPQDPA